MRLLSIHLIDTLDILLALSHYYDTGLLQMTLVMAVKRKTNPSV